MLAQNLFILLALLQPHITVNLRDAEASFENSTIASTASALKIAALKLVGVHGMKMQPHTCEGRKLAFAEAYKTVEMPEDQDPCRPGPDGPAKERCVVSISMYCPKGVCEEFYTNGIQGNIEAIRKVYPGWKLRIYTDGSLPKELSDQITTDVSEEVVVNGVQGNIAGMFWRLFATHDPNVDRVIIRDADSRVNLRERATVNEWIRSGKKFHEIRDHPYHGVRMLGGAWGVMKKPGEEAAIPSTVIEIPARKGSLQQYMTTKGGDQDFLRDAVYPLAKYDQISHDSYLCGSYDDTVPIPVPRRGPRDVVCYPNGWKDEDELYQCEMSPKAVYAKLKQELAGQNSPVKCRPQNSNMWEFGDF